jgi:glycosidase
VFKRSFLPSFLSVMALLLSFVAGSGAPRPAHASPTAVSIPGSFEQLIGCANDWDPACAAAQLTNLPGTTVWSGTFTIPAGSYEYKAALNDSWDINYGANSTSGGDNIHLNLAAQQSVSFYYDDSTHWITDSVNSVIATTPGDFNTFLGCSIDWDPGCMNPWLEDPTGSGTYSYTTTSIPAGTYHVKVAINRSWDVNYGAGGAPNGANISFTVPSNGAKVVFSYNPSTHLLTVLAGHSHDNNVEYNGLGHNSQDTLYRTPFGAVTPGTSVTIRFRTYHNDVTGVKVRFYNTATNSQFFQTMSIAAANVSCYDPSQPTETCDFWQTMVTPTQPTILYYRFIVADGTATAYYADTHDFLGGWGQAAPNEIDNSYAISVYSPSFNTIPWARDAVIYQIFPDRFRNGDPANDPKPDGYTIKKAWTDLPEGYCQNYVDPATPCTESPHGRDYFGGDLLGIVQKLPYLHGLGINTIYLNPIFVSGSNHGYDTYDYMHISPHFGTDSQFQALAKAAHALGIKIILDGVFNHVSSSSMYFDRYHHFSTVGACESMSSPYRSWFYFQDVAPGTGPCAGSAGPNSATYTSWAGFDSLPVLNKSNPQVQQLFYGAADAVVKHWLRLGADGWRFDVMSDPSFPDSFWQGARAAIKAVNPGAMMYCECWQRSDQLSRVVQGTEADSSMDYRFRDAILGFFGTVDYKGFPDDGATNESPTYFAEKLMSLRADNPDASYYTMMNLMDSHDTQRILWSLTPGRNNREDKEFNAANLAQGEALLNMARVVQMTTPGAPTIYYGDEVGLTGDTDPDDRRPFPWTTGPNSAPYFQAGGNHTLFDQEQSLIALRASHPVLREGALHFLLTDDTNRTLAYLMRTGTDAALVALNRNTQPETLTIKTSGWLPANLRLTGAYGPIVNAAASDGTLTLTLPAYGAAILFPAAGQDLIAPGAASGLQADAGNAQVSLSWNSAADAASYAVYRSPVSGGGYTWVANTNTPAYMDTGVTNGRRYYYIVRTYDAAGNEGPSSQEVSALPYFPIVWADTQWPPTINRVVSTEYSTIYGQVYVPALTDSSGDPAGIIAQLGFGAQGTPLSSWSWTTATFNTQAGNNFEYKADVRPPSPGTYDYLYRYSTDLGVHWTYADFSAPNSTGNPGVMTATASSDTTAPSAPTLQVADWSTSSISLSWSGASDSDDSVAEYWVYRATSSGAYSATPLAIVTGATSYTDTSVNEGTTYYYTVKAVDHALNLSPASNEVHQAAQAKLVAVTFNVTVPAETTGTVYIAGNFPAPYPTWDPGGLAMTKVDATHFTTTLNILDGTALQYKYTRGTWDSVEKGPNCEELSNRTLTVSYGATGMQSENDTVAKWRDLDNCS